MRKRGKPDFSFQFSVFSLRVPFGGFTKLKTEQNLAIGKQNAQVKLMRSLYSQWLADQGIGKDAWNPGPKPGREVMQ